MIPSPHWTAESPKINVSKNTKINPKQTRELQIQKKIENDNIIKQQKKALEAKRLLEDKKQQEELIVRIEAWKNEIIPQLIKDKYQLRRGKFIELCWKGVPSNLREHVWPLFIGNSLQLTEDTYQSLKLQADLAQIKVTDLPFDNDNELNTRGTFGKRNISSPSNENAPDLILSSDIIYYSNITSNTTKSTENEDTNPIDKIECVETMVEDMNEYIEEDGHMRQDSKESQSDIDRESFLSPPVLRNSYDSKTRNSLTQKNNNSSKIPTMSSYLPPIPIDFDSELSLTSYDDPTAPSRHAFSTIFSITLQQPETVKLIEYDLPRTFPTLAFFHDGGPVQVALERILRCYAYYKPKIGYVQGMSYLAAVLLLYMEEQEAFICLANLLDRRATMDFYGLQRPSIDTHVSVFNYFFKHQLPALYSHMDSEGVTADMYLMDWHLSLFAKCLPLEAVVRVWDVYLSGYYCEDDGEIYLLRIGLGLLHMFSNRLLTLHLEDLMGFLVHFPEKMDINTLIKHIQQVHISKSTYESRRVKYHKQISTTESISPNPKKSNPNPNPPNQTSTSSNIQSIQTKQPNNSISSQKDMTNRNSFRKNVISREKGYMSEDPTLSIPLFATLSSTALSSSLYLSKSGPTNLSNNIILDRKPYMVSSSSKSTEMNKNVVVGYSPSNLNANTSPTSTSSSSSSSLSSSNLSHSSKSKNRMSNVSKDQKNHISGDNSCVIM